MQFSFKRLVHIIVVLIGVAELSIPIMHAIPKHLNPAAARLLAQANARPNKDVPGNAYYAR